jgi:Domain of unknown function (DUF4129)
MMKRLPNSLLRITAIAFAVLGLAVHVSAIPLSEYHKNLLKAITALDTLAQVDEDETNESYHHRLIETSNAVRNIVPEKQPVESKGSSCTVDNTWLHKKLDEFEATTDVDRLYIRRQLIDRLKAIEERVGDLERATTVDSLSKNQANQKVAEILSRPEYANKTNQGAFIFRLLDRFIRWLAKFLPQRSPLAASHGSPLTAIAQILVIALAAAVIIYVLIKLISHFGRRSSRVGSKKKKEPRIVLGEHLEPEASATDLLAEAEALARKGEIRAAIRKTYIALLVELGDRKIISLAQHKTNRDYLRAVSHVPSLYSNMGGLTNSFERHWYGFAQSSPSDWQEFKTGYIAALKATE